MDATISQQFKIGFFSSVPSSSPIKTNHIRLRRVISRNGQMAKMKCAHSGGSVPDQLDKLEEELIGMKRSNENCKGVGGIVELVECLEREEIMGENKGIEASDYHRRARIFDKSSEVFQALKERESSFD